MRRLTIESLKQIFRETPEARLQLFLPYLRGAMSEYVIDTPQRQAMFLAQIGHESGRLKYVRELASGEAYEGRKDLGNTEPGDGVKYKGRGLIQITGRRNYTLCGMALDLPLLEQPELLEQPHYACTSAGWFWWNNNLNRFADVGDLRGSTRAINGGYNGLEDRTLLYKRALTVYELNPIA